MRYARLANIKYSIRYSGIYGDVPLQRSCAISSLTTPTLARERFKCRICVPRLPGPTTTLNCSGVWCLRYIAFYCVLTMNALLDIGADTSWLNRLSASSIVDGITARLAAHFVNCVLLHLGLSEAWALIYSISYCLLQWFLSTYGA